MKRRFIMPEIEPKFRLVEITDGEKRVIMVGFHTADLERKESQLIEEFGESINLKIERI